MEACLVCLHAAAIAKRDPLIEHLWASHWIRGLRCVISLEKLFNMCVQNVHVHWIC